MIDHTHDPKARSWLDLPEGTDFPLQNLPLGMVRAGGDARPVLAIGDWMLDLLAAREAGLLAGAAADALDLIDDAGMNALLGAGPEPRRALRLAAFDLLAERGSAAGEAKRHGEHILRRRDDAPMALPVRVENYTDFYAGIHHAVNVGRLFRPDNPLLPNYKYVPIGYHGRASTVRPSGTPVRRPQGQLVEAGGAPAYLPTRRLDIELEMGIWVGEGNPLGSPIPIDAAADRIAGLTLLNDWSARDIQAWEYQPLGPFLSKSFLSTVSPWIITAEALAPFRIPQPPRPEGDPRPLPHLWSDADQASGAFAVDLAVSLRTARMRQAGLAPRVISSSRMSELYWTAAQMIAHHSSNGCALRPGDLLGTGTISGPSRDSCGSLLEITRGGAEPLALPGGETRRFLEDGDEIVITGRASAPGRVSIGFGECAGTVQPAA